MIIAHITGASPYWTNILAVTFVVLRLVYTMMYIYDKAAPRSVVWAAALACVFALFGLAAAA